MTVAELILALQDLEPEAEVVLMDKEMWGMPNFVVEFPWHKAAEGAEQDFEGAVVLRAI